jgi:hypothetical protein
VCTASAEILPSAAEHDIVDADVLHPAEHGIARIELGDDPIRLHLAGTDRAGNLLELVTVMTDEDEFLIHAVSMRSGTAELLMEGDDTRLIGSTAVRTRARRSVRR